MAKRRKILMVELEDHGQTEDESLNEALPDPRLLKLLLEAFTELTNRIRVLEGNDTPVTKAQVRNWFKQKLKS